MKLNILIHNVWGLNDPDSILRERRFLNSLTPKVDIVLIQKHKLRGKMLNDLGTKLMIGGTSLIP